MRPRLLRSVRPILLLQALHLCAAQGLVNSRAFLQTSSKHFKVQTHPVPRSAMYLACAVISHARTRSSEMKGLAVLSLLAIAVASVASLVSGASYLEFILPGGLPAGNALAAIGLASAAAAPVLLSPAGSALRAVSLIVLAAATAWLPLSVALAGNLALNFAKGRGSLWLGFSLAVSVAVLCILAWALVSRWLAMRRRVNAA